jgi:hypothetical protein
MGTSMQSTSLEAFESIKHKISEAQQSILKVFHENPNVRDWTNTELAVKIGWSINRVTPRVHELRQLGILEKSGQRNCRITGYTAISWRIRSWNPLVLAIVEYLSEETGVPAQSLRATVDGDEVILCANKWLDEGWNQITEYVDAMDGEWISAGKSSRWIFPVDRIKERLDYERQLEHLKKNQEAEG